MQYNCSNLILILYDQRQLQYIAKNINTNIKNLNKFTLYMLLLLKYKTEMNTISHSQIKSY